MILSERDYEAIAEQIHDGSRQIVFEKDDEVLLLDYEYSTQGYVEDDYYRGTGAFVETARELCICNAECYNSNGEKVACDIDETRLKKLVA